ncbi:MAG: 50S ribosomal protein L35ae [Nanoarchaeota archaeon]|jgi:large subunit ribosomal protein L35Ae|nr:50S ribosomal protein L35ae [Nanoarchaeota archaeon]|tara:strand:- start:3890 stop:4147 length:258 start_codon:yes stop_codon:yes gene_type:complete
MKARIVSFRRSRRRQNTKQVILKVENVDSKDKTKDLIGKEMIWKSPSGKEIKGKVSNFHGNSGAVRVILSKGVPGQAIGEEVELK